MLERVRETFGLTSATLLEQTGDGWVALASAGPVCATPRDAETEVPAGDRLTLALRGRLVEAEDRRLLGAFAAQVAVVVDRTRLSEAAAAAAPLAEANKMRSALLAAVGHDLRTPLAAAKASVSSLLSKDIKLTAHDRRELLTAADESLDRLAALVDNLLDMSRLQAGALPIDVQATAVDEVVARTLYDLGPDARTVLIETPDDLPLVRCDPGLLERVLANLVGNALRYSPPDKPPLVTCSHLEQRLEIRVVDRGNGIPPTEWDQVFLPFQRLGDTDNTTGIGLGLALARGLTEAMGGTLEPEETPGGGLTMLVSLPADANRSAAPGPVRASGCASDDPSARRRRRAQPAPCAQHQPASPQLRGAHRGFRRRSPQVGRCSSHGCRRPRSGSARHGRHGGGGRAARVDERADPCAVRPFGQRRQGGCPRCGGGRLCHQALRHGGAVGPAARGDPAGGIQGRPTGRSDGRGDGRPGRAPGLTKRRRTST